MPNKKRHKSLRLRRFSMAWNEATRERYQAKVSAQMF